MTIGEAAKRAGISTKRVRHYEEIGVLSRAARSEAGYRIYDDNDVHILRFVNRARNLGFSMEQIKRLVGLWKNRRRASREVKKVARIHLLDLEHRIAELQSIASTLRDLSERCSGDDRPDCPILQEIEFPSVK